MCPRCNQSRSRKSCPEFTANLEHQIRFEQFQFKRQKDFRKLLITAWELEECFSPHTFMTFLCTLILKCSLHLPVQQRLLPCCTFLSVRQLALQNMRCYLALGCFLIFMELLYRWSSSYYFLSIQSLKVFSGEWVWLTFISWCMDVSHIHGSW